MKRQTQFGMMIALAIFFCTGCSTHNQTRVILPENTLDSSQLRNLFVGNTVESVTVPKGRKSLTYYDPQGLVRQQRGDRLRVGQWRITKRGRICLQMENQRERCRIILQENNRYNKYIVKKSGDHRLVVSYTRFMSGNPLGL